MRRSAVALLAACGLFGAPALAGNSGMPANIQAIMKKMSQGQSPSADDQKALEDWSKSLTAGATDTAAKTSGDDRDMSDGDDVAQRLCRSDGHAVGLDATPSQTGYLAMAKEASAVYGARMPDGGLLLLRGQLDRATNPTWGGDLSLLLLANGSGSAAIVAATDSARRAPTDALTANNLGIALRGMKDYARAAAALRYAQSLAPDSPVIASNLGWLAQSQGDVTSAERFFDAALGKSKEMSIALGGKGLLAQCAGRHGEALKLFRASLASGYSRLAAMGVDSAESDIQKGDGAHADVGQPQDADAQAPGATATPNWPDPPIPTDARTFVMWGRAGDGNPVKAATTNWDKAIESNGAIVNAIGIKADIAPSKTVDGGKTTFRRGFEKESFFADDALHIATAKLDAVVTRISADEEAFRQADGCLSCAGDGNADLKCSVTRPRVEKLYPGYARAMRDDWTQMRQILTDFYAHATPWLAKISNTDIVNARKAYYAEWAASHAAVIALSLANMQAEATIAYVPEDPLCGRVPPLPGPKPGTLKPYPIDPNACRSGETHMNFGLVNFNADCEKMTLDFGEALVGSGEYKFGNDWGSDQLTIFAGVGVSGGIGPLSAGAKTGSYITFQGGQVTDYGNQSSASISVGSGPLSAGSEASARISAVAGVDASLDSGVHIGGVNPE